MRSSMYQTAPKLVKTAFRDIFPVVTNELMYWRARAEAIPNADLRDQALASIDTKTFHCQGGSIYSVLSGARWREAVTFIVAYQTISDYLDNLCDRSDSLDPNDFRSLHQSMLDAITLSKSASSYYQFRKSQNDGGYLTELVQVCQKHLSTLSAYPVMKRYLIELARIYIDLQVHKHVDQSERVDRLKQMYKEADYKELSWYEYSAATGSTLGIFCMVSYAFHGQLEKRQLDYIYQGYFPYLQGLHILLDYLIDQNEDRQEGDLNFCAYYPSVDKLEQRLLYFIERTKVAIKEMRDLSFHRFIYQGLIALYLSDPKIDRVLSGARIKRQLLKAGGIKSVFFYYSIKWYNRFKNKPIKQYSL
ncbi:tetraprenyl-beta-curcumene synthase family protein [Amphibacillus cookii]|uniref:tetraprenyl-beta-curcumene synthase family protein n=1 Tax=Amphibacillus cookii TaxID=767787 RepID=UPI00195D1C6E|nr:tetraprenyl-beta-curcumene synthase family protein [Amphibacillus cookii]MBM7541403.1 tetraprenyl-beta-curcumene synthase [Amphibacillus cookii]